MVVGGWKAAGCRALRWASRPSRASRLERSVGQLVGRPRSSNRGRRIWMRNLFSFRNHMYIYIFTAVEESTRLSFGALARVVNGTNEVEVAALIA